MIKNYIKRFTNATYYRKRKRKKKSKAKSCKKSKKGNICKNMFGGAEQREVNKTDADEEYIYLVYNTHSFGTLSSYRVSNEELPEPESFDTEEEANNYFNTFLGSWLSIFGVESLKGLAMYKIPRSFENNGELLRFRGLPRTRVRLDDKNKHWRRKKYNEMLGQASKECPYLVKYVVSPSKGAGVH